MKKIVFTITLIMVAVPLLFSQWTNDVMNNTLIHDIQGSEQSVPMTATGLYGQTYISWFDNSEGSYQLKMQLLDSNGVALWAANGIVISNHPQNSALYRYDMSSDKEGNAIVAFQDERTGNLQVVAYKIDPAGNFTWGPDGILMIDSLSESGMAPVIGITNSNDVIIAWSSFSSTSKWISFNRLNPTGTILWPTVHRISDVTDDFSRPSMVPYGTDSILMQYVRESGNFPGVTCTMYANCFDAAGDPVWANPALVSAKTISYWYFPKIQTDYNDGFYLTFTTSNPQATSLNDVYVQHMDQLGNTWNITGIEAADSMTHKLAANGIFNMQSQEYFALLQVLNTSQGSSGIYLQKFDQAGNKLLGNNGLCILPINAIYYLPYTINKVEGGMIIIYQQGNSNVNLYAIKTGFNGIQLWPTPVAICTNPNNKDDLTTLNISEFQVAVVWMDQRLDYGIYAQNISFDGYPGIITGIEEEQNITSMQVYPNPGTCENIIIDVPTTSLLKVNINDIQGRLALSEEFGPSSGTNNYTINTNGLKSGVYILSIVSSNCNYIKKLIIK